eukprot:22707-Chlamydomonas_euryale.AAC.1
MGCVGVHSEEDLFEYFLTEDTWNGKHHSSALTHHLDECTGTKHEGPDKRLGAKTKQPRCDAPDAPPHIMYRNVAPAPSQPARPAPLRACVSRCAHETIGARRRREAPVVLAERPSRC